MLANVSLAKRFSRGAKLVKRLDALAVKKVGTSKMEHAKSALMSRVAN
jgi:hypothetical protein